MYTNLPPGRLTDLRAAAVNNEIFARVAVKHNLHVHLRHGSSALEKQIRDILLKENQELRAKYDELEKNYKLQNYVNEKCNESLHRAYNEKIERIVKEFEHKIETVENNRSLDRKSYNDELEKWISSNADLSTKLELVKTALIAERHSPSNNSDTKALTDKFHKTENELNELRRLLTLEKEKVSQVEKVLSDVGKRWK
ncbi:ribonuclease 3-like protein 3 [Cynara cardunculus var. scolymus]|uniref:ribonuclease 3-like protein 3 n=1 Tax=Cynara cardunculus var. scolymus TaxID=59895 RepID=UPI000D6307F2|nr:ribonuclease 3-like protein 3 [Cynara cardunculus var. scolymus]